MAKPRKNGAGAGNSASNAAEADAATAARLKPKRTRKSVPRECPSQRSSAYRGVTRHRWTGRFEAHLWDKNTWNESQSKKGRQVYLGAYDGEEAAARAYDLAALKYWGRDTVLNFPLSTYDEEWKEMEGQSREEYIGSLRRKSSGFSRGVSKYRGVARHHHNGKWEARIGRVFGNKYLYLGTYGKLFLKTQLPWVKYYRNVSKLICSTDSLSESARVIERSPFGVAIRQDGISLVSGEGNRELEMLLARILEFC